jgi:threonyl-tRNA synthetase
LRVRADLGADRMNAKIRDAQLKKVPYMLVVGEQEMAAGTVSIRKRDGARVNDVPVAQLAADLHARVSTRAAGL